MNWASRALTVIIFVIAAAPLAGAQTPPTLYRVFLQDGSALSSFGEWARVDDRIVFSMPLATNAGPSDLHLVSLPVTSIDLPRSERYADAVRAASYATSRGEADFAQLSGDVAHALDQVALIKDPIERLSAAERARRSLVAWPSAHYGYRAAEVKQFVEILDDVIAKLRVSAGQNRFDLAISTTTNAPGEPLIAGPDHTELVQQLMTASTLVTSPAEKISLLQSVLALLDRAIDILPKTFASTVRTAATGRIADEQRIDTLYSRLRGTILRRATAFGARANVRGLERLRTTLQAEDAKLGGRRPEDIAGLLATLDTHLDAAHRLRLAQDQWLLRAGRLRAYRRAAAPFVTSFRQWERHLDDIRAMAGPSPQLLRPLAQRLSNAARRFALLDAPGELTGVHAVFRSAYSLAQNAVQLRLDAAEHADVELARQAAAAASGALMLLSRARADLAAALQPPIALRTAAPQ